MKKIIALLLVAVMCLAVVGCNSGSEPQAPNDTLNDENTSQNPNDDANTENSENNINKELWGEWIKIGEEDAYAKFFEDGTAEIAEDGMIFDFEWEYDFENKNYRANIMSRRWTFNLRTEEGITYLSGFGGYYFRAEDRESALAATPILRENYIKRQLEGETMLIVGEEIPFDKVTIVFEEIFLSEDKEGIQAKILITAKDDIASGELSELLFGIKHFYFDYEVPFDKHSGGGGARSIKNDNMVAGETLSITTILWDGAWFSRALENWGKLDGYFSYNFGETTYYFNLLDLKQ